MKRVYWLQMPPACSDSAERLATLKPPSPEPRSILIYDSHYHDSDFDYDNYGCYGHYDYD